METYSSIRSRSGCVVKESFRSEVHDPTGSTFLQILNDDTSSGGSAVTSGLLIASTSLSVVMLAELVFSRSSIATNFTKSADTGSCIISVPNHCSFCLINIPSLRPN